MIFTYILEYNGITHELENEPVGWDAIEVRLERDRERHGIDESIEVTLQFHCQGAGREFIESALDNGIDEQVKLFIYLDCGTGNELFYEGVLKLADSELTEDYYTVPVEQTGIQQTFLNRVDTDININGLVGADGQALTPLPTLPTPFTYHSRAIKQRAELETELNTLVWYTFSGITPPATSQPTGVIWALAIQPQITIPSPTFDGFTQTAKFNQNDANLAAIGGNLLIQNQANLANNQFIEAGIMTIDYNISGTYYDQSISPASQTRGVNSLTLLIRYGESIPTSNVITLGVANAPYTGGNQTLPFSFSGSTTITIGENDKIWVFWFNNAYQITAGSITNSYRIGLEFDNFELSFETDSVSFPTDGQAFPIYESTARVVEGISNVPIKSDYFGRTNSQPDSYPSNGCGSFTVLTNGFQIRNLRQSQVYVNWKELFTTLQAIFNVGWGWENGLIRIEDARYFYSDTLIDEFDDVNSITKRIASEFYTQRIEIGYDKWETNDLFITDEPQTKRQYVTRLKTVDNSIEAIAPYITSSYAIEVTRRLGGNDTYREYNERNFIIAANRELTSGQPLLNQAEIDENFSSVTNIRNSDTTYNLRFTPVKNLVRWFKTLNIGLTKYISDLVRFQSGEGNILAETVDNIIICDGGYIGLTVSESGNYDTFIGTDSESTPLFEPLFIEFEYPLTWQQYKVIRQNPYGYLIVNGNKYHVMQIVFRFSALSTVLAVKKWE